MRLIRKRFTSRKYIIIAAVVVVAIAIGIYFVVRHSSKQSAITIPSAAPTTQPSSGSSNSTVQPDKNTSNLTNSGLGPTEPFGNFVSNHTPGNGSPTQEKSTCNTTPGAICYIQFTMGTTTKKLDAQTTDGSGAAYWTWDVKDAGFSEGPWQIAAVATLNGQTSTTQDQIALTVQP